MSKLDEYRRATQSYDHVLVHLTDAAIAELEARYSEVQRLKRKCRITYNDFCRQPCAVCGLVIPPWAPPGRVKVAHHRNPSEKTHSPSELSRRGNEWWKVLVAELRKCEPLCANCHAVVHDLVDRNHYDADDTPWTSWDNLLARARTEVAQWSAPGIGEP